MKWLLLAVLAAGCASTATRVASAQGALEYHRARYERVCAGGMDGSAPCIQYGTSINTLVDVIDDLDNNTDTSLTGTLPKNAKRDLDEALKALGSASDRISRY